MKYELICQNCGGKRFDFRASSRRMGGWDENGERRCSTETYYCKKCGCPIEIEYYDKLKNKTQPKRRKINGK